MEVHNTKGRGIHSLAIMLCVMLIVLLNAYCCGAAVLVKSNASFQCDGRLEECLFELEELDLELLVNPYVSRMLGQRAGGGHPSQNAVNNPGNQAVKPCGPGDPYRHCLQHPNGNSGCMNRYSCARQER